MRLLIVTFMVLAVVCVSIPEQAAAQADAKAQARAHYKKAKTAFEAGKYKTALAEYQGAYRLMPLPGFLFNIGQCYRNMKKPDKAIVAFKRYLKQSPKARNREAVEGLIAELEAEIDLKTPLPGPGTPTDPPPDPDGDPTAPDPDDDPKPGPKEPAKVPDYTPPADDPPKTGIVIPPPTPPPSKPRRPTSTPIYKKWWFWTIIGAAVAGGAVGTYLGVRGSGTDLPASDLGVLDFSR